MQLNRTPREEAITLIEERFGSSEKTNSLKENYCNLTDGKLPPADKIKIQEVVIDEVMRMATLVFIIGGPKLGKSFLAFHLAEIISSGGDLWGSPVVSKKRTLFFDTELSASDHLCRGFAGKQSDELHIILAANLKEIVGEDPQDRLLRYFRWIREYCKIQNIKVVIIDCLYRLVNENSAKEMKIFVEEVNKLKRMGLLIIVVHHTSKTGGDDQNPFNAIAGHSTIARAIDGGILLRSMNTALTDEDGNILADKDGYPIALISVDFMLRSFPGINQKYVYFDKLTGKLVLTEASQPRFTKEDALKVLLKKTVPQDAGGAIATGVLIDRFLEYEIIVFAKSTLKKKLPLWVEMGLLSSTGNKPKRYYWGPVLHNNISN